MRLNKEFFIMKKNSKIIQERNLKKHTVIISLLFFNFFVFSESIISGFGIFYHLPYDEALVQIEKDGFVITEKTDFRDTNTDRKIIRVDSFEYDYLPYKNGTFCFDRDIDGKYYFTISEGDVDTDKIDNDMEYAAKFSLFLEQCKKKYIMQLDETEYSQLVGFRGDNGGYIILSISEKLHIAYFPKSPN